jgi:hypothetical protein
MCVVKIHAFTSIGRPPSWSGTVLDKVKVDLVNFDVKLGKLIIYFIFLNTYSCQDVLQIFFYFMYKVKKWSVTYIVTMWHQKSGCSATPHPLPTLFYCCFRPPEGWRSPNILRAACWGSASQGFNLFPVWTRTECWGWYLLSWVCSLALSKWTDSAALFWTNSQNRSTLYTPSKYRGR